MKTTKAITKNTSKLSFPTTPESKAALLSWARQNDENYSRVLRRLLAAFNALAAATVDDDNALAVVEGMARLYVAERRAAVPATVPVTVAALAWPNPDDPDDHNGGAA